MSESDLIKLYSQRILALASDIPHAARLAAPTISATRRSPLCGSAVNRRAWPGEHGGLHHVLDARTGEPVRTYAATWAIAAEAMLADAAATALFFDGGAAFADRLGVEWVRMTTAGAVEWSAGDRMEVFA